MHASTPACARALSRLHTCFCIPSVMSTCERMQFTHILDGLDWMLVPHRQHRLPPFGGEEAWGGERVQDREEGCRGKGAVGVGGRERARVVDPID